jgi:hypothetical protein
LHIIFFFFPPVLGLEWRAFILSHYTSLFFFVKGFFQDRVSWTICPGLLQTTILLSPASWIARITGVSHWLPAAPYSWHLKCACIQILHKILLQYPQESESHPQTTYLYVLILFSCIFDMCWWVVELMRETD